MKSYSVGMDNLTRDPVRSQIPGHQAILDLGFAEPSRRNLWERFWIIGSRVDRTRAADGRVALLDVPLGVKTQAMVLRSGRLVPAPNAASSRQAREFTRWFAENLDAIDREVRPAIPEGNGVQAGIAVFAELRRLALITAMAEALRDQGVPLPSWMRGYRVKPFAMPSTTPAVVSERTRDVRNGTVTQRVYGGVSLASSEGAGFRDRPPSAEDEALALAILDAVQAAPALEAVAVSAGGRHFRALALPTDSTRAKAACRLREVDLTLPGRDGLGHGLSLIRFYNSFHQPRDIFGNAWTLDLPYLAKELIPIGRRGNETRFRVEFQLASPLGSISGRVGVEEGVVDELGVPSYVVRTEDRTGLHFHRDDGALLSIERSGRRVVYRRGKENRLDVIESWEAGEKKAEVRLDYRGDGTLASARGSNGEEVRYGYDASGMLVSVDGSGGAHRRYAYGEGLLTRVARVGMPDLAFAYNERGQLRSVNSGDTSATFELRRGRSAGERFSLRTAEGGGMALEFAEEDDSSRALTLSLPGEGTHRFSRSADGRAVFWQTPRGETYELRESSPSGLRRAEFLRNGRPSFAETRGTDGRIESATIAGTLEGRPQVEPGGTLAEIKLSPARPDASPSRSLRLRFDSSLRLVSVSESAVRGAAEVVLRSDESRGETFASGREEIAVHRDGAGRTREVRTSWGHALTARYLDAGGAALDGLTMTVQEPWADAAQAQVSFIHGKPSRLRAFDGGELRFEYRSAAGGQERIETIRTPGGLSLSYQFDEAGRPTGVSCAAFRLLYRYDGQGRLVAMTQLPPAADW